MKRNQGDTLESPTAKMEYGFAEFGDDGRLLKPSWIRTSSRETHGDGNTRWLETVEYSDGMGNIALVKTKAAGQKWVGTGRTVLNNKGNPVKQYEPYFSGTDGWESEPEMREQGVTPILHYDPLSRLIRTDFPDGTHSKVEFTAWEQRDFDRCDTAAGSPHFNTPTVTHLDSLGRAFCVIADDGANHNIATRTVLDIEGNEKQIIDARGNTVMEYGYGIHGEKCYSMSMDAGERWMLPAADGQPVCTWDSRGNILHTEYDALRRPISQKLSAGGGAEKLVGKTEYGTDAASNLIGKPWKIYDQSGMTENVRFDFKGNLLETRRQLVQEYKNTIDWNTNPAMEKEEFVSATEYDALNRATNIRTPRNAGEIMPTYDDGGLLKTVKAKLRGAAQETEFVTGISYNPKGQREKIKYGNGATTKYEYDEKTFRLTRLLTTRSNGTDALQDLNYEYDQMGNITGITDNAQQTIFFNGQVVNPSQTFEYDALYRLIKATGREHASINADSEPETEGYNQAQLSPEDGSAMRNYERQWQYDQVGNILQMIHQANGNSWTRNYNYDNASNRLMSTEVGNADVNYTYNEHGSMNKMPHLQNMQWNFAEQLNHITRGTTEAYYNYDASGQRTRKIVEKNNVIEERLYLGGFEIWRKKVNGNLDTERETLHIMDDVKRIAVVETKTIDNGTAINNPVQVQRYQLGNNIESATLELDESANIISYEEYYPYGETSYSAGRNIAEVGLKRYRYTGKEKDEESGLYYYGARYYACWLGRWTATDPAGLVDGLNLYMYCRGSPVQLTDPNGTQAKKEENPNSEKFVLTKVLPEKMRDEIRKSSYDGTDASANTKCYKYSETGAINAAKLHNLEAQLQPAEQAIAVAKYYGKENIEKHSKNEGGDRYAKQKDIMVDPESAKNALNYIKTAIDKKLPVVAGVNVSGDTRDKNYGEVTDHFVIIVGYGESLETGNITKLLGIDPGISGGLPFEFDVNSETGKATKAENTSFEKGFTVRKAYQLDQVRLWKGLEPNSSVGVGAHMKGSDRRK